MCLAIAECITFYWWPNFQNGFWLVTALVWLVTPTFQKINLIGDPIDFIGDPKIHFIGDPIDLIGDPKKILIGDPLVTPIGDPNGGN